ISFSAGPGGQPPDPVTARRPMRAGGGEGESRTWGAACAAGRIASVRRPGFTAFRPLPAVPGFGPGAAVADGVSLLVGDRDAPRRLRVPGSSRGQLAGQG